MIPIKWMKGMRTRRITRMIGMKGMMRMKRMTHLLLHSSPMCSAQTVLRALIPRGVWVNGMKRVKEVKEMMERVKVINQRVNSL